MNHDIWALSRQLEENGDDINKTAGELVELELMVSVQKDSFKGICNFFENLSTSLRGFILICHFR